ncbi:XRE family transcriptional regulator [Caballeronia sp. Lep1P3]|uniref:XRE family transcriptional regulator n=1 Tax=Caballeronia sp. Lep1P3 TaxID=2878150 RepID=UPI001FD01841|nr:XRE family transcriptional regulator [Caballeronia sp. Lep1P3]
MADARINPAMLTWARERSGIDGPILADKLGTPVARVAAWEAGERKPTFKQAKRIAEITHIPLGYLYLPAPPDEPLPLADFRTVADAPLKPLSPEFRDALNDVLRKQSWYREYRRLQRESPLPFIGRFGIRDSVAAIASDIKRVLAIGPADLTQSANWESYLRLLIERMEAVGVLVMRTGIVGNNTHRPLSVDEFRGFAIADDDAPVVFLNGKDAKAAQIFTLIHEAAHLWVGVSSVSNERLSAKQTSNVDVERFCNAVAAEFLVPEEAFRSRWTSHTEFTGQVRQIARELKVSNVVAARRAAELGLASRQEFDDFYLAERDRWAAMARKRAAGGNYYETSATRNSKRLTRAVLETALEGRMLLRDAGQLLGVNPSSLEKLAGSVYGEG